MDISWSGQTYPFKYAMADVTDNTNFGNSAAIFLSRNGLTESFPLPNGIRRWVVNHELEDIDREQFFECIQHRTGFSPDIENLMMFSEFEIHRYRAARMFSGRVILTGDALGVMSPIGGQAMSLHWVQAKELAKLLHSFKLHSSNFSTKKLGLELEILQKKQLARLDRFSGRSHFNTIMGLPGTPNWILISISKLLLAPGIKNYWSKRFSMQDLL